MKFIPMTFLKVVSISTLLASVHAHAECTLRDVAGKWGFSGHGVEITTNTAYTTVGMFVLNRDGTGNGVMYRASATGYTGDIPIVVSDFEINPVTCIGKATIFHPPYMRTTKTMVFTRDGKEVSFIDSSGNITSIDTGRRM